MSEHRHTPGPWEARNSPGAGWSVRKQHERPGYTGLAPVCSMAWWQFDIPGIIDDEISGANAHLIAAAPDLLEACEAARKELSFIVHVAGRSGGMYQRALEQLEAAIAKAAGKGG